MLENALIFQTVDANYTQEYGSQQVNNLYGNSDTFIFTVLLLSYNVQKQWFNGCVAFLGFDFYFESIAFT